MTEEIYSDEEICAFVIKRAAVKLDPCNDTACKFNRGGKCSFGLRDIGCYMEDCRVREIVNTVIMVLARHLAKNEERG